MYPVLIKQALYTEAKLASRLQPASPEAPDLVVLEALANAVHEAQAIFAEIALAVDVTVREAQSAIVMEFFSTRAETTQLLGEA